MIVQHYSFRCDVKGCPVETIEVRPLPRYLPIDAWPPKPALPAGWHRVDDGIICPAHARINVATFVS